MPETTSDPSAGLFLAAHMNAPVSLAVAGGTAAVFSTASPARPETNQDGAAVLPAADGRAVLVVADGVGGQAGGDKAAALALQALERATAAAAPGEPLEPHILGAIQEANQAILDLNVGAGTTLAIAELTDEGVRSYHAGDSAVLLIGGRGRIRLETIAHSPVGYALASGLITEEQALLHEERHLIYNAVGNLDLRVEVGSNLRMAPRDTLLLATDGLLDNVSTREISMMCPRGSVAAAATAMAELAAGRMLSPGEGKPSKPDDLTFVVWRRSAA